MATITATMNTSTGTFMFHPRQTVFDHPITYNLPTSSKAPVNPIPPSKPEKNDLAQYYITLEARTTIHKSSKGPISVAECDAQGKSVVIENTSRSKSIALSGWILRQENDNGERLTFTFPDNCLLRPNHSLKVLTRSNESERRNGDLIASAVSSWHTGSNVVTTLINVDGRDRASLTKKTLFS